MISSRFCFLVHADEQVRGDRVGELAGIVHADGGDHGVVVQVVRELHVLLERATRTRLIVLSTSPPVVRAASASTLTTTR